MLIPITLGKKRLKERGYNQVALVARPLAHELGLQYSPQEGMREVHAELRSRLAALEERLAALRSGELAELESLASALDLPRILLRQPIEAEELH